jgi:hypothetical protein
MAEQDFKFTINGRDFALGLYEDSPEKHPGILTPALLEKTGDGWKRIEVYDTLWEDIQNDVSPSLMANLIVKRFNTTLSELDVGPLTWNQKLAAILFLQTSIVNGQIVIT